MSLGQQNFVKFCIACSLIKMVSGFAGKRKQTGQIKEVELEQSIRRNFSGLDDLDPVEIFRKQFKRPDEDEKVNLSAKTYFMLERSQH